LKQKNPGNKAEAIEVLTEEKRLFPPPPEFKQSAHIKGMEEYTALYKESVEDPEGFWDRMAGIVDWTKKWDKVFECDLEKPEIKWFLGGRLNAAYNCIDRHLKTFRRNKAALIWESDEGDVKTYTYRQLSRKGRYKGRPRYNLPFHDTGARDSGARLRQDRGDTQRRLRGLQFSLPQGAYKRL
jgi:hypothetical protein